MLPARHLGHTRGSGPAEVEIFLDYCCPFSSKAYKTIFEQVQPKLVGRCKFTFHHQVQPWHPQSTAMHEAALAVAKVAGEDAFWTFSDVLMAKADGFYDVNIIDKTRQQVWDDLISLAVAAVPGIDAGALKQQLSLQIDANPGALNMGCGVTQDIKWAVKYSRLRSIHVSPTTAMNGLVFDSSSSWTQDDWLAFFDKHLPLQLLELPAPPEKASEDLLSSLSSPVIIDARDAEEVATKKGGEALAGSVHVPLNMNGAKQSERPTTKEEFLEKLTGANALPEDQSHPIITHCGNGGRGGKAAALLRQLGYWNAHNGGSPDRIRACRSRPTASAPLSQPPAVADSSVLAALQDPIVIDARDPNEVEGCKGGPAIPGCVHVPMNIDGLKQTQRPTTTEEFYAKLQAAGALPADRGVAIITHCGSGGRGGKTALILRQLGFWNAHNGGSPDNIRAARTASS